MYVVLLALLSLGVQLAHSALPFVQEIKCKEQNWPDHQTAAEWKDGKEKNHQGFDETMKKNKYKIADFSIKLKGIERKKAAVLCDIEVIGADIEAFWVTNIGKKSTESFIFGYGEHIRNKLRIGIRANHDGKIKLKTTVEIYGSKKPTSATITCGAGPEGKECLEKLELKPRMKDD